MVSWSVLPPSHQLFLFFFILILTCLLNVFLLLFMTPARCILFYILVFHDFFHTFVLNNLTSFLFLCSVYSILATESTEESIFYQSWFFFYTFYPSSICCEYGFYLASWLNCQISSSLDLFLTEYIFSKFLIIVLINLHVQGLFNLIYESHEFSPRETYKGSWKHFSFFSLMGFNLSHNHADIFTQQVACYWRTCSESLLLSCFDTFGIICYICYYKFY